MSTNNDGGAAFPVAPGYDPDLLRRFVARVDMGDGNFASCWPWTGARTPKGYGVFSPSRTVQFRAHRFAFHLYMGRAPREQVLHNCDNPSCVNPLHLMEGSHGENMRQMAERRRAAREERHHKAKLDFAEVLAVNLMLRGSDWTQREVAKVFKVHQSTIAAIALGSLWPEAHALADAMLAARAKDPGR